MDSIKISSDIFTAIETLLFLSDEREFPEYCYQGEFSISQDDIDLVDADSVKKLGKSVSEFLNEAGIENVEDYEDTTARSVVRDAIYTVAGSGITFETTEAYEHLRMCAKKHLGWLEFAGPTKGNDGKIYF